MPPPFIANEGYDHLRRVEWPQDLPGKNYWVPKSELVWHLPQELKESLRRVTASGKRFYQKVKQQPAPMIPGDITDPDTIHALQFAIHRQDEFGKTIELTNNHPTEPLLLWLRERKRSHVKSMQAVVVAEEGEMYDMANKEPWEVKLSNMTDEHVEHLRFIFRTVMARIDIVSSGKPETEKIQPGLDWKSVKPGVERPTWCRHAPSLPFWKIDESLMESSTLKMRQAASGLYHQGRVMTAGRNNMPVNQPKPFPPVFNVVMRAMVLTIRSIELVWAERHVGLPKEEEERLLFWLRERKDAAVDVRLAMIELHLPVELGHVHIHHNGRMAGFDEDARLEWCASFVMDATGHIHIKDHEGR